MQASAEIRWFHDGAANDETMQWFSGGRKLEAETRTDRYLVFPGCESGGVKLRSYKDKRNFEIKLLRGAAEPLRLPHGVSGRADAWVKWSYGDDAVHPLVEKLMGAKDGFVDVKKTRYLRKFSLDDGGPVEVDGDARPKSGCGVELTLLEVGDARWWSFAFEAFGDAGHVRNHLEVVARHFLDEHRPVDRFDTANSCSYPAWLAALEA